MNKFLVHWDAFWFRQAPPHAMAILRIAFGMYLLTEALTYFPFTPTLFSAHALTYSAWAAHVPSSISLLLEPPPEAVAWIIASVYLLAALCFTLGWAMRTSIVCLLLLFFYYWQVSFFNFPSSYHRIYTFTLIGFFLSGADRTFSLRMLRIHGSMFAWEPISIFAQHLIAVQITVTYLGVGLQKAWLPAWQDGAVLSHSLIGRWATPLGRWVVGLNFPFWVYSLNVLLIKIGEVLLPCLLWTKTYRWIGVAMGFAFHAGIGALMSIWWFIALIPAYILFWQPEEVYEWCRGKSNGRIS